MLKTIPITKVIKQMKGEKLQVRVKETENWINLIGYISGQYFQKVKVPVLEVANINDKKAEYRVVVKFSRTGEIKNSTFL